MTKIKKFLSKNIIMISFITVVLLFELFINEEPINQSWIFILLLLCPVVHIFMHNKHNHKQLNKKEEIE